MPEHTLLDELQRLFPDSSKTTLRKMLQSDRVRVNGAPERNAKRQLGERDRVEVGKSGPPPDPRIRILHEDADLLVVDKPVGLLTVPGETGQHESVEELLNARAGGSADDPRVFHVHRLDRDTSGVLVFAKNNWTREKLQALFSAHNVERVYVAIVEGKLSPPSGTFRSFLMEERDLRMRVVADATKGKEAVTHYRTIASGRRFSMLEITLETGRRNQIRVQLAEAKHPVVGDTMYGSGQNLDLRRLGLHARRLGFVHPRTREKMLFDTDLPAAFRELKL